MRYLRGGRRLVETRFGSQPPFFTKWPSDIDTCTASQLQLGRKVQSSSIFKRSGTLPFQFDTVVIAMRQIIAIVLFLFCLAFVGAASSGVQRDEHEVCMGHPFSYSDDWNPWITDPALKDNVSKRVASPIPTFQVNLGARPPS